MSVEDKIREAAAKYAVSTWNHDEERFACMDGFKAGAEWLCNEMIKQFNQIIVKYDRREED